MENLINKVKKIYSDIVGDNYYELMEELEGIAELSEGKILLSEDSIEISPATDAKSYAVSFVDTDGELKLYHEVIYFGF